MYEGCSGGLDYQSVDTAMIYTSVHRIVFPVSKEDIPVI